MDNFYELPSTDELKELWDSDMDPGMQDVIRLNPGGDLTVEWTYADRELAAVVIHDRLMTDAALGTRPIKTEHSYSLQSDGDSLPDSPVSHHKVYEMEEECFPAISMDTACCKPHSPKIEIKDEPFSDPESPHSSCPPSPEFMSTADLHLDQPAPHSLLATPCSLLTTPHALLANPRAHTPAVLKLEGGVALRLPPTPPSSSGSEDSEDNAALSRPPSPSARRGAGKGAAGHTRQPIHTPLISSQPKGSTGTLILTAEEKRTLIAEGYPIPTRLPLTKAEEKSLKKIRRKIKNKISAQESRRKKKEYMDQLERKVELLASENCDYRKKIESLENTNGSLMSQLQKLQAMVARTHPQVLKQMK